MKSILKSVPGQIVVAVICGIIVGLIFPNGELGKIGDLGKVVIHWVKLVAGPLLFLTVLGALLQVHVRIEHGVKLVGIALFNTGIALTLGIFLSLAFFQGIQLNLTGSAGDAVAPPQGLNIGLEGWIKTFMPSSFFQSFVNNDILLIALTALLLGIAIRRSGRYSDEALAQFSLSLEKARDVLGVLLRWLVFIIPLAVFAVIAATVSKQGLGVFADLAVFVAVVLLAFIIQVVFVYGSWIFIVAKIPPRDFFKAAKEPLLYALGVNSSLASLPFTLNALKKLKVSDRSASLGAGVATNLNNDGIVLYEAMAVFFIAFALGVPMDPPQMILAALTCIVASMGITGIPEAGFISLSVVVGVLGLPLEVLPLLLAVDWAVARFRSAVNVLSDMTLSIALDATTKRDL